MGCEMGGGGGGQKRGGGGGGKRIVTRHFFNYFLFFFPTVHFHGFLAQKEPLQDHQNKALQYTPPPPRVCDLMGFS